MNAMKKVVWITFNAFIDTDLYIVRELISSYQITWYIIKSGNDTFEYQKEIDEIAADPRITVYQRQCGERLRSFGCIAFYNGMLKEISELHPDAIYTTMAGAPFFIPVFAMKSDKKKVALAIHNVHVPKGGSGYYFFKMYNTLAIRSFRNFQTFSEDQYHLLRALAPKKNVTHIPFVLKDYGPARNERKDHRITFLNFGNIREYKRIDVLIEAAQRVYEATGILFRVILAGKCENWERYQEQIRHPELFELYIHRIENEMVPDLFAEADYYVAPYQDIAQSGSSVVAINYSIPIIASRLPAFEEYIEDNVTGRLIEPADVDSLEKVMEEIVVSNNAGYSDLVENLENQREKLFSVKAIVNRYKEFIDGIIENS